MVSFKEIPNIVLVLIVTVIILVVGSIIFVQVGDSGILVTETWTNETITVGANATTPTGFRISFPHDNVVGISMINLANNTNQSWDYNLPASNYTLYSEQGYIDVVGRLHTVSQFVSQDVNITGTYYNDTILDQGVQALETFGSWLGILVIIMLAAVIFGLFKYFGAGAGQGSAY